MSEKNNVITSSERFNSSESNLEHSLLVIISPNLVKKMESISVMLFPIILAVFILLDNIQCVPIVDGERVPVHGIVS